MTKLKNSNYDKTQKLKLWQNSKNPIVTKLKKIQLWPNSTNQIVTPLSSESETRKHKLWQNSKTQIVTVVIGTVVTVVIVTSFSKTIWHLDNRWCSGEAFLNYCQVFGIGATNHIGREILCLLYAGFFLLLTPFLRVLQRRWYYTGIELAGGRVCNQRGYPD